MCLVCLNYKDDWIDPGSFLVNQLYSAATSSEHRIVIEGLITLIARLVGVEPNPDDKAAGSKRLNLAAFEQMKFCKVDGGRICQIYPGNQLIHLLNVDRTTLLNRANLYFYAVMKSWCRLPHLFHLPRASSSSQPSSSHDYPNLHATHRLIQEE